MRKNCKDVLHAWNSSSRKRVADSIWTENGIVYSYRTVILERRFDGIIGKPLIFFNATKYSSTTSVHQNAIWAYIQKEYPNAMFIVFDDLYRGVQSLKDLYPDTKYNYRIISKLCRSDAA